MDQHLDGIRKSAILLLSLPDEQSRQILSRLPRDVSYLVNDEMCRLDEIPESARQAVLRECCRELGAPGAPPPQLSAVEAYRTESIRIAPVAFAFGGRNATGGTRSSPVCGFSVCASPSLAIA